MAANELCFQEIVDYLQKYLIENKSEWMEQHFEIIQRTSSQSSNLLELQQFCTNLIAKFPEKIFKSTYFTSLPEKTLVQIIKKDDLRMKEVEIWEQVLKWGLAQNSTLIPDPDTWSDNDFKTMEDTLQHCLPSIRFFSFSSKVFLQKVKPYKKLLKLQLYKDLKASYLDPDSEPNENILLPRSIETNYGIIESKIINVNIVSTILTAILHFHNIQHRLITNNKGCRFFFVASTILRQTSCEDAITEDILRQILLMLEIRF